ncbi:MAG: hypothetical protein MJ223_03010 [Mycoplasmoidaceae bacterium]|nr:hypothetical protein [Mycoplasmoidaceae bacterium]
MVKQNIKIALLSVFFIIGILLIMLNFLKIDICTQAVIAFDKTYSYIAIENESSSYIENNQIDYVRMEYEKQYFNCHITYVSSSTDFKMYLISLPEIVEKTESYLQSKIIVDSLNVYEYLIKK